MNFKTNFVTAFCAWSYYTETNTFFYPMARKASNDYIFIAFGAAEESIVATQKFHQSVSKFYKSHFIFDLIFNLRGNCLQFTYS